MNDFQGTEFRTLPVAGLMAVGGYLWLRNRDGDSTESSEAAFDYEREPYEVSLYAHADPDEVASFEWLIESHEAVNFEFVEASGPSPRVTGLPSSGERDSNGDYKPEMYTVTLFVTDLDGNEHAHTREFQIPTDGYPLD